MKPYSQYKNSDVDWIGEIPTQWKVKKLKWITFIIDGDRGKEYPNENDTVKQGIPFLSSKNLIDHKIDYSNMKYISHEKYEKLGNGKLQKDDLVVTVRGTIGNTARFDGQRFNTGFINAQMMILRGVNNISSKYLWYFTLCDVWNTQLEISAYGSAQKQLSNQILSNLLIPTGSKIEQQKIANYLDHKTKQIDTLIEKKQRLIELLKEERTAVINEAVTKGIDPDVPMKDSGIEWIGEVPKHWSQRKLKRSIIIRGGQVDPRLDEYASMILIAPNHIESSTGRLLKLESAKEQGASSGKYMFQEGDVLYSKIRPELSKACIAPNDGLCSADMYAIEPIKDNHSEYILFILLCDVFTKLAVDMSMRVAMPKINREDLSNIVWYFPPFNEQVRIASHIQNETTRIDTIVTKTNKEIELLHEYRTALISEVVTGKIDVRDWEKPEHDSNTH